MEPDTAASPRLSSAAEAAGPRERIAVFVAWPYANGPLHVGHIGGSLLPPDIFARYHRLRGADVVMLSGSDTHGTPVSVRAEAEGRSPVDVYREWHQSFLETFQALGISFDLFTHTDTPNHHTLAKGLFVQLADAGVLVVRQQPQLYSPTQKRFLPDRFVEGTCPNCGYDSARGDQCDHCGKLLDATDLIGPRARFGDGGALEVVLRDHYFLDLPRFGGALEQWLASRTGWRATVQNGSLGTVRDGLKARAITRDLDWGIPVPLPGWDDKVMYVWFEAVMGYLSATIEHASLSGDPDAWRDIWYDPSARAYYFMGKDNIIFHSVIWPAILMGVGRYDPGDRAGTLNLPSDVVANEYVNFDGGSMSTSRGIGVWLPDYLARYDPDPLRYYLTMNAPETRDVDFTWPDFVTANNNGLLATWGNLVNRVLKLAYARCEGRVPEPGPLDDADRAILARAATAFEAVGQRLEERRFKLALAEAMAAAHEVNRYVSDKAPWASLADDPVAGRTTLYVALRAIDDLKTVLAPFLPHTSQRVHAFLGYDGALFGQTAIEQAGDGDGAHPVLRYRAAGAVGRWAPGDLPVGQALREPDMLVRKLDEAEVLASEAGGMPG